MNPEDDDKLYIGIYKGLRIITEANLPYEYLNEKPSFTEKMSRAFSKGDREMYVFGLNSVINLWGYSKIIDNKRIRAKFGTHDQGVIHEEGQPLESERELIENSQVVKGDRVYHLNGGHYNEDQIGEEFVFRIINEVTGERIDKANEILSTEMTVYELTEKKSYEDIFKRIRDHKGN